MTISFFKALSALPNELVLPILRGTYPPEAFNPYDPYTNRGTVSFWDTVLKADSLMGSISQIDERFQEVTGLILDELAATTSMRAPKGETWKTIEGMHWRYRQDAEWQWGYGAFVR